MSLYVRVAHRVTGETLWIFTLYPTLQAPSMNIQYLISDGPRYAKVSKDELRPNLSSSQPAIRFTALAKLPQVISTNPS